MHPIVTTDPAFRRAVGEPEERNRRAKEAHNRRAAENRAANTAAMARWKEEKRDAVLDGQPVPPKPEVRRAAGDYPMLQHQEEVLARARRAFLRDHAVRFEQQLRDRGVQLLAEAEPHVAALQPLASEMASLLDTVQALRRAAGDRTPVVPDRDTGALVRMVEAGQRAFLAGRAFVGR